MANEQQWATGVNTRILRDTTWQNNTQFIEDETRSGKTKRRLYGTQNKKPFEVKMRFTETEYAIFDNWFEETLKSGLFPFYFSQIDRSGNNVTKVYRFANDGAPKYSNPSAKYIDCSMKWEEM